MSLFPRIRRKKQVAGTQVAGHAKQRRNTQTFCRLNPNFFSPALSFSACFTSSTNSPLATLVCTHDGDSTNWHRLIADKNLAYERVAHHNFGFQEKSAAMATATGRRLANHTARAARQWAASATTTNRPCDLVGDQVCRNSWVSNHISTHGVQLFDNARRGSDLCKQDKLVFLCGLRAL